MAIPTSFATHAAYAGVQCSGRTAADTACRALTTGTVTVAGTEHSTCRPHAAQVEEREVALAERKVAQLLQAARELGCTVFVGDPVKALDELAAERRTQDKPWTAGGIELAVTVLLRTALT